MDETALRKLIKEKIDKYFLEIWKEGWKEA